MLAITFGARVFEKHFTLNNELPGPDHWFSENPDTLKIWVESIRNAYDMLGSDEVKPTKNEERIKLISRRSIVALRDINKGEIFSRENIGARRPGNGLPANMIENIFGRKSIQNIKKGNFFLINFSLNNSLKKPLLSLKDLFSNINKSLNLVFLIFII